MKRFLRLFDPADPLVLAFALAACLALLSGCSNYGDYAKVMQAKFTADGAAAVAKAEADGKKWDALAANKTPEGAVALGITAAISEVAGKLQGSGAQGGEAVKAPRDWVDTGIAFLETVIRGGRVAVDLTDIRERGKTARAAIAADEEKARITADGNAKLVDAAGKNGGIHIAAGGDAANGGNVDKRDCSSKGGAGASGAPSGGGGTGGTGTATTGTGTGAAGAPSGSGGQGGAGGAAGGNCGP